MGIKKRKRNNSNKKRYGRGLKKNNIVNKTLVAIKNAVKANKTITKNKKNNHSKLSPRILPVPKTGGILPLIPIFAGLSAIGALTGGAAGIAKAVNDATAAKQQLKESERHNRMMEAVSLRGRGLYLTPYKKGFGLNVIKNCQRER